MIKKYITLTFWRRQTDNCQLYHSALGLYLMQMKKQENKGNQSDTRTTYVSNNSNTYLPPHQVPHFHLFPPGFVAFVSEPFFTELRVT